MNILNIKYIYNLPIIDIEGFADLTILSILKSYILQS